MGDFFSGKSWGNLRLIWPGGRGRAVASETSAVASFLAKIFFWGFFSLSTRNTCETCKILRSLFLHIIGVGGMNKSIYTFDASSPSYATYQLTLAQFLKASNCSLVYRRATKVLFSSNFGFSLRSSTIIQIRIPQNIFLEHGSFLLMTRSE